MAASTFTGRALVDALDEPALVVEGSVVRLANDPARALLGGFIEGRDLRLAIRHPQALDRILSLSPGELDVTGIAEPGRSWRLIMRHLGSDLMLIRLIDRSDSVSAEKMRVDFVANASHELRTPLSTVLGYAETLAEEDDLASETCTDFGRTIRDEASRMLRIIEDLMSLSRIEADRFVAPSETVDVAEVIRTAIANSAQVRGGGQRELVVKLPDDLPPVRGDRAQLVQVFDNLISNAVRYGCDRPDSRIDIAGSRNGRWVTISVTERFYRVDEARSRESGGTGLGLAIVKHIIERHKGTLEVKSTVGVGTSVTIRLPVGP
jgi:two-component system phosphate regulon sensor histidine kinase PhoR